MPLRASLQSFMAAARSALAAPPSQRGTPLTFVVGNESADLDSLCSAVFLAYIRSSSPPHKLHIPLSNIPRSDLELRTEMTAVLRQIGLSFSDLLTLSELPELSPQDTHWLPVDHNSLTGRLARYSSQVIGCVDHHVDEETVVRDAQPRVIEPCGSCMSLIVEETASAWDEMDGLPMEDGTADVAAENDKLAKLALAPILIDTVNLTAEDKIRPKDRSAVEYLKGKIRDSDFDTTRYNDEISALKEDISSLSFRDIFRKDYKEWEETCNDGSGSLKLGISSVVQNLDYLVSRTNGDPEILVRELQDWAEDRGLDVAGITTASHSDGAFERNLLVWGLSRGGVAAVKRFVDGAERGLKLETWSHGGLDGDEGARRAWRQLELKASRKKVAPMLREALKGTGLNRL